MKQNGDRTRVRGAMCFHWSTDQGAERTNCAVVQKRFPGREVCGIRPWWVGGSQGLPELAWGEQGGG